MVFHLCELTSVSGDGPFVQLCTRKLSMNIFSVPNEPIDVSSSEKLMLQNNCSLVLHICKVSLECETACAKLSDLFESFCSHRENTCGCFYQNEPIFHAGLDGPPEKILFHKIHKHEFSSIY